MKPATQGQDVIRNDNGDVIGINIGFDFAAEHEWGIGFAGRYLGRPEKPSAKTLGAAARTTTRVNESFKIELVEYKGELWLRGQNSWRPTTLKDELKGPKGQQPYYMTGMLNPWKKDADIRSAWSGDSGFIVVAKSDDAKTALRLVFEALNAGSCFISQASGVFGRGGLCFVPANLIPAEYVKEMVDADASQIRLAELVAKNGILDRLKKAEKRYYACSPRWNDEKAGTFGFWLNPCDQRYNRYGWVTIQDLDDWIANKGRIPFPDNRDSYAGCVS